MLDTPASPGNDHCHQGLIVKGLRAGWGKEAVIFDIEMEVKPGSDTCLLGHNGDKTTTASTVMGALKLHTGTVVYQGKDLTGHQEPRPGMSYIPSERFTFPDLTVHENLALGAIRNSRRRVTDAILDEVSGGSPIWQLADSSWRGQ